MKLKEFGLGGRTPLDPTLDPPQLSLHNHDFQHGSLQLSHFYFGKFFEQNKMLYRSSLTVSQVCVTI